MEKDLFPSRHTDGESARDLPPVLPFPMPRMEAVPHGGCHSGGDAGNSDCHSGGEHGHGHDGSDCGCHCHGHNHGEGGCGGCHGQDREDGCGKGCVGYEGCGADSWGLTEYPPAMVYAPCQSFRALYDPATALCRGTLFTELDLPLGGMNGGAFVTEGCSCRAERRRV